VRLASFNVENLFARAKVLDLPEKEAGPLLKAYSALSTLLAGTTYSAADKTKILAHLGVLGLVVGDQGPYARLRVSRGQLLRRPRSGDVVVVADGRGDWVGWVELITEAVDEKATEHTAMVIRDLDADVMGVVEAESRPTLKMFSEAMLLKVGAVPYEQVMLVDGNDDRGIDVGLLARKDFPLHCIRTHVFDADEQGVIFSRDCCGYHVETPSGESLVILVNHFKSKGYGQPGESTARRKRQAARVAQIYRDLVEAGETFVAVVGDLNDDPTSDALAALITGTDLTDISEHPSFDWNHRQGTYGGGGAKEKIDYVLLSPALFAKATGGGVFRKGVWHGSRTRDPWDIYPTMTSEVQQASDHAAIYADLDL